MTTFDEREKAFESKFKHDEELRFRVVNRRNKLFGQWAAGLLGLDGADADAYAAQVVEADFEKPGDDDVLGKVERDLEAKGVDVSDHRVRKQLDACFAEAKKQLMQG